MWGSVNMGACSIFVSLNTVPCNTTVTATTTTAATAGCGGDTAYQGNITAHRFSAGYRRTHVATIEPAESAS